MENEIGINELKDTFLIELFNKSSSSNSYEFKQGLLQMMKTVPFNYGQQTLILTFIQLNDIPAVQTMMEMGVMVNETLCSNEYTDMMTYEMFDAICGFYPYSGHVSTAASNLFSDDGSLLSEKKLSSAIVHGADVFYSWSERSLISRLVSCEKDRWWIVSLIASIQVGNPDISHLKEVVSMGCQIRKCTAKTASRECNNMVTSPHEYTAKHPICKACEKNLFMFIDRETGTCSVSNVVLNIKRGIYTPKPQACYLCLSTFLEEDELLKKAPLCSFCHQKFGSVRDKDGFCF